MRFATIKRFDSQKRAVVFYDLNTMIDIKEREKKSYEELKKTFGYTNRLAAPRLQKVVVSVGTGKSSRTDKKRNEFIKERLAKIVGQAPSEHGAKKSIASFKLREGEIIGYSATLRKRMMYDFLNRLINVAIPRIRDFRGLNKKSVDEMGNVSFGIKEHNVFPETAEEELKDVFGLAITIVTTAKNQEEGTAFFESIGVPFKK